MEHIGSHKCAYQFTSHQLCMGPAQCVVHQEERLIRYSMSVRWSGRELSISLAPHDMWQRYPCSTHMAGKPRTTLQDGLTETHSSWTQRFRRRSSVTVHPLPHERMDARSGSIDIPSTARCVATISMLNIWQGSRAQPSRTV